MTNEIKNLRDQAYYYKGLLLVGEIDINTAKDYIYPYIEEYNKKAIELAKKYKVSPKKLTFTSFIR